MAREILQGEMTSVLLKISEFQSWKGTQQSFLLTCLKGEETEAKGDVGYM